MSDPGICDWCDQAAINGATGQSKIHGVTRIVLVEACDQHAPSIGEALVQMLTPADQQEHG